MKCSSRNVLFAVYDATNRYACCERVYIGIKLFITLIFDHDIFFLHENHIHS